MKISSEELKRQYRGIYEALWTAPRIYLESLGLMIGVEWRTTRKRLKKAHEQQIIRGPEVRKRSYGNLGEYMYFITSNSM